jgi:hypothetical protein
MQMDSSHKILLVLFLITLWVFLGFYGKFQNQELSIREKEFQIKEETYISTLLDQYNRDLQGCFSAAEKSKTLTRDKCIENINNSRVANLLKNWGYSDLLLEKEK